MGNKFTDLLNITLSGVNDIFEAKITKFDDSGSMSIKAFVVFTPKATVQQEALGVYHSWFADKPGVMLELSLFSDSMFIRAVSPPLGQTIRKRNFETLNEGADFMKALRDVMLGLIREWRKVAKRREKSGSVQWASEQIHNLYLKTEIREDLFITDAIGLNKIAINRNHGSPDSIERICWSVEPAKEDGSVKIGIEISAPSVSKDKLNEIFMVISQLTK